MMQLLYCRCLGGLQIFTASKLKLDYRKSLANAMDPKNWRHAGLQSNNLMSLAF